ncbi:flagellar basal body-associated FliL family protein [Carboxydochorda subterranea]|uniref:Flagellar protein FliL n=1 Tax=Carboxydichorda subterranea TaxID=3109565 RepID=A0ABZ1C2I6_9FIRM|nr:flagellar basal body-associated FliL family protein [Limnochorda sp. L945t]WRP18921.1 flagellar basal body-associated FliL family protein [Limnochorda sp. L945t]
MQQPPAPPAPAPEPRSRGSGVAWAILIVALIIAASTGSAFLAYLMFNRALPAPAPQSAVTVREPAAPPPPSSAWASGTAPLGPTLDAGEFIVNLAPGPGMTIRYVRMGVVIEGDRKEVVAELEKRQPQVRDTIIAVVRASRFEELATAKGGDELRGRIVEALQKLVVRGRVVNVYFTEFVIQ